MFKIIHKNSLKNLHGRQFFYFCSIVKVSWYSLTIWLQMTVSYCIGLWKEASKMIWADLPSLHDIYINLWSEEWHNIIMHTQTLCNQMYFDKSCCIWMILLILENLTTKKNSVWRFMYWAETMTIINISITPARHSWS